MAYIYINFKRGSEKVKTFIDDSDLVILRQHQWFLDSKGYAASRIDGNIIRLHRFLMNPQNLYVDHINGNKLDNRRKNLRLATHAQNQWNTPSHRGYHWSNKYQKWVVQIRVNGTRLNIGQYQTEDEAKAARKNAESQHRGEFARKTT